MAFHAASLPPRTGVSNACNYLTLLSLFGRRIMKFCISTVSHERERRKEPGDSCKGDLDNCLFFGKLPYAL